MRTRIACLNAVLVALAIAAVGCGGAGSGGSADSSAGGPLPKADAVDVTYYYVPG